jgi:hypothetical protein
MWRVCKEAGRPWPVICDDDVVDYMVMEAVALAVRKEDDEEVKRQERERFKKDHSQLEQFR